ncbi:unnamed protein product [Protopolystoma xenopodis]|uniref:Uncharacterized protein n=1 Tax=Protopolystoma xenopodis TaxID=117903 RepID=A0A3S5AP52_9PLAT|nr:unnamed protein product [Protopolystoma xenopodis]
MYQATKPVQLRTSDKLRQTDRSGQNQQFVKKLDETDESVDPFDANDTTKRRIEARSEHQSWMGVSRLESRASDPPVRPRPVSPTRRPRDSCQLYRREVISFR